MEENLKTSDATPAKALGGALSLGRGRDREYTTDYPEVIEWGRRFQRRAAAAAPFARIGECLRNRSRQTAAVVGANWLSFSTWLPSFLTLSAARVKDNLVRHYLIQIAYEELGGRRSDEIHCRLFAEALAGIGIGEKDLDSLGGAARPSDIYDDFYGALIRAESTAEILGLNLGVEIIADENIETLFSLLAYSDDAAGALNESAFFRLHRAIEEEHLRLSISNFLKFCGGERERASFSGGFDRAIAFWRSFWDRNHSLINAAA